MIANRIQQWATELVEKMRDSEYSNYYLLMALVGFGIAQTIARYGQIQFGSTGLTQFFVDSRNVWKPLADSVLLDGNPLFTENNWDNKPPVWQFLNLLVASTGLYFITFHILIGIANGVSSYLIFKWCQSQDRTKIGLLAALLFIGALPAFQATRINPRPFAQVLILGILFYTGPVIKGLLLSLAALLTQFSIFAAPAIFWKSNNWKLNYSSLRWTALFSISGIVMAVVSYGVVGLIWGTNTLFYAVEYTIISGSSYGRPPYEAPLFWAGSHAGHIADLFIITIPLAGGILYAQELMRSNLEKEAIVFAAFLSLPFLLRPGGWYYYPPLPFYAVIAASVIIRFIEQDLAVSD